MDTIDRLPMRRGPAGNPELEVERDQLSGQSRKLSKHQDFHYGNDPKGIRSWACALEASKHQTP
jgi:hypothetical protein